MSNLLPVKSNLEIQNFNNFRTMERQLNLFCHPQT